MRHATLAVAAAALAVTLSTAPAQDRGNVASGRDLAGHWCGNCHRINGGPPGAGVSTFVQVARLPSTTALSLRVFLRSSHADMPNIEMSDADADDLVPTFSARRKSRRRRNAIAPTAARRRVHTVACAIPSRTAERLARARP